MLERYPFLMDYIKYFFGNAVVIATAIAQPLTDELLWRGRLTWCLGLLIGVLTVIKLYKDIKKK